MKKLFLTGILLSLLVVNTAEAKKFKWTSVNVPEEGGISFVQITKDGSDVSGPRFYSRGWYTGSSLSVSPDGNWISYIAYKNKTRNIYLVNTNSSGSSVQRTFRASVNAAMISPDGENIVFSETRDDTDNICITSAHGGNIIRQVSAGAFPAYTPDSKKVFFSRYESSNTTSFGNLVKGKFKTKGIEISNNYSVWSYDLNSGQLTNYAGGCNPKPLNGRNAFICERNNELGYSEIWLVDIDSGSETLILSQPGKNFTTPSVSPDGRWIVLVANSTSNAKNISLTVKKKAFSYNEKKENTDIYVVRIDGTALTQLTYHKGNDCEPCWSPDGKYIYFKSQRGSAQGDYNVWRMNFNL